MPRIVWTALSMPLSSAALGLSGPIGRGEKPASAVVSEQRVLAVGTALGAEVADAAADGANAQARLDEAQTRVLLKLLTRALEARSVVAGRITAGSGGNDVLMVRLVPSPSGTAVRTAHGVLHLPGLRLEISPAGRRAAAAPGRRGG